MISPELVAFIRKELAAGVSREDIKKLLIPNGWSEQDMREAFAVALPAVATSAVTRVSHTGRKVLLSLGLIFASAAYTAWVYLNGQQQSVPVTQNVQTTSASVANQSQASTAQTSNQPAPQTQAPVQTPTPTAPVTQAPTQAVAPTAQPQKPAGQYVDGTYTGSPADAYYGTVQIQAVIQNGALADVKFLQYPSDRGTSRYINSQAMPQLISEALQAQSANVNAVSGASDTSQAFVQSLGSALAQAKN